MKQHSTKRGLEISEHFDAMNDELMILFMEKPVKFGNSLIPA